MKRLVVCSDGTWQQLSNEYPTNVVKIAQAIKVLAADKTPQIVFYDPKRRKIFVEKMVVAFQLLFWDVGIQWGL